eukprot:EG_transcript_714
MAHVDIEAVDVAVEDLLRVEVTYGRLTLVLKGVLDKLRSQSEALNNLKEGQEKLNSRLDDAGSGSPTIGGADDLRQQLARLQEEMRALQDRLNGLPISASDPAPAPVPPPPAPSGAAAEGQPGSTLELDDSILDDILADHHRRLRNLEEEQKANITNLFLQLGLKPPAAQANEAECALRKAELASNLPGAVSSIRLATPLRLKPGRPAPARLVLSAPAVGGALRLLPACGGLSFAPKEVVVPAGSTTSQEFTVEAAADYRGHITPFIQVNITPDPSCETNVEAAPFVVTGVVVERAPPGAKGGAQRPAGSAPPSGRPIQQVSLPKETSLGVQSDPLVFQLDNPAEGGPLILTPEAPNCTFSPPQVVVPVGATRSGSFLITPTAAAEAGALPITLALQPVDANANDVPEQVTVSGLSIDPRAAGARAAREKEAKAFQQRPNPVAQITMSSTVADAGGQASDVACLTLDRPVTGGALQLIPAAPGIHFVPATVEVPEGHTTSQPFVVKASELAKPGPALVQCSIKPLDGNSNTLAGDTYPVVGLTVQEGTIFGAGYDAVRDANSPAEGLVRSGLSERMRGLMDDHERRLKGLETTLRAALAALRPGTAAGEPRAVTPAAGDLTLFDRIRALEDALAKLRGDVPPGLRDRWAQLLRDVDRAQGAGATSAGAGGASDGQLDSLQRQLDDLAGRLAADLASLGDRVRALDGVDGRLGQLQGTVRQLADQLHSLGSGGDGDGAGLGALQDELDELRRRMEAVEAGKADRADLAALADRLAALEALLAGMGKPSAAAAAARDDADLRALVQTHAGLLDTLATEKAGREAVVRQGQEIQELKALIEALKRSLPKVTAAAAMPAMQIIAPSPGDGGGAAENTAHLLVLIGELERRVQDLAANKADKQWTEKEIAALKDAIDDLHQSKADASLVAGKAERDYVENALERLRREVEQAMNNTNGGLIDTLDKSLNILRDMIDGKASQSDLSKIRDMLLLEGKKGDGVPEGLAGYKNYRCLSCNRKMDGMRPRPMGMNFSNFVSHLPNPRPVGKLAFANSAPLLPAARAITGPEDYPALPPIADGRTGSPPQAVVSQVDPV